MINKKAKLGNTLNGGQPVDVENELDTYFGPSTSFLVPFSAIVNGFPELSAVDQVKKFLDIQGKLQSDQENTYDLLAGLQVEINRNLYRQRQNQIKRAGISYVGPFSEFKKSLGGES